MIPKVGEKVFGVNVTAVHTLERYTIVVTQAQDGWDARYYTYVDGLRSCYSYSSLEEAMVGAVADSKGEGSVVGYIMRMLGFDYS